MNDITPLSEHVRTGVLVVVAILGSALGYVSRTWGMERTLRMSRFIFSIFAALFMLILLKTICSLLGMSYEWTLVIVGLFSWLGTDVTVAVLERIVHKKIGVSSVYVKTDDCNWGISAGHIYSVDELHQYKKGTGDNKGLTSPAGKPCDSK